MRSQLRAALCALCLGGLAALPSLLLSGCAAASAAAPRAVAPRAEAAAPPPIECSLFARDPGGQLNEEALQRLIATPPEVALPARVGVLPILGAADSRGPGPDYGRAPVGAAVLTAALRGTEPFPLATEVMPIPSGALGMEALREIAARYRLRYLVLYREEIGEHRRQNGWTAGYLTVLGAFFLPGQTLRIDGYIEASLFDVKTGSLLLTTRQRIEGERWATIYHNGDKLEALRRRQVLPAAERLAQDLRVATARLREAVQAEAARTVAPIASAAPSGG